MSTIRHKRSSTAGKVPLPSDLVSGEIATNTNDGVAYIKRDDDVVVDIAGVRRVTDRAALKALNTNAASLAFLSESGREGLFKWTVGDFSAQIAADTVGALFIKADSVAASAGAWARVGGYYIMGRAKLDWFGVPSTGADATAALAAALTVAAALGVTRLEASHKGVYPLVEMTVPAGTFDIDWNGSTILCDFNGSVPGATANAIRALNGTATTDFAMRNFIIEGGYIGSVTLTAERRILDIAGFRRVDLVNGAINRCGRGGATVTLIMDREDRHTNIHNCEFVNIDGLRLDGNVKFEGVVIQSTDKRTQYNMKGIVCVNHASSGTPISVFNCGPGRIEHCYVDGLTGSAVNGLSEYMEICHNTFKNISDSNAIDCYEGGIYYAHGAYIHHNEIDNIGANSDGIGIRVAGNGIRVEHNRVNRCLYGISAESNIGATYPTYGTWLTPAAKELSGIVIKGNRSPVGHNSQGSAINANVRVLGTAAAPISFDLEMCDEDYQTTKSEYAVMLAHVRHGRISGKIMAGRDALIRIFDNVEALVLDNLTMAAEAAQAPNYIVAVGGVVGRLICNRTRPIVALGGSRYHIVEAGGTFSEIQLNDSASMATFSLAANTRVMRDGRIYKGDPAFAPGSVPADSRVDTDVTVPGVRSATDEVHNISQLSSNNLILSAAVTADNTVKIRAHNPTGAAIAPTISYRLLVGPKGYQT